MAGGVLVGVDGSEPSWLALDWAAGEATVRAEPLTVLCVANDDVLAEPAFWTTPQLIRKHAGDVAGRARERARRAGPALEVHARVLVGAAVVELEKASSAADLLVLGSRGLGAFAGMLIGSVSDRVAWGAACRVVVVRGDSSAADRPVLLGLDGAPDSAAAAEFAFATAERRRVAVVALTAAPPAWGGSPDRPLPVSGGGVGTALYQMQEIALRSCTERHLAVPVEHRAVLAAAARVDHLHRRHPQPADLSVKSTQALLRVWISWPALAERFSAGGGQRRAAVGSGRRAGRTGRAARRHLAPTRGRQ